MSGQHPRDVVNAMYAAWFSRDIPGVLAVCDDMVRVSQYYDDPLLPFTGTTVCKQAYADRLALIFADWRFERADHEFTYSDDVNVRTRIDISLRHLKTTSLFDGMFRHIFVVRRGRITQIEEYVDIPRLKSFLRTL